MAGTLKVNRDGSWKTPSKLWYNVSGAWKEANKAYCKINGAWVEIYSKITYFYNAGSAPNGGWTSVAALPSHYAYQDNKVAPTLSVGSSSVYAKSAAGTYAYTRGGSIYLPKTTITGNTLKISVTNAFSHGNGGSAGAYLGFGLASSVSGAFATAAYSNIGSGYSNLTGTYSIDISSISGGSYYPFVSLTTSSSGSGTNPSYLTINAFWCE